MWTTAEALIYRHQGLIAKIKQKFAAMITQQKRRRQSNKEYAEIEAGKKENTR
jgi:hypothetical protein